jgi:hypothetical protein
MYRDRNFASVNRPSTKEAALMVRAARDHGLPPERLDHFRVRDLSETKETRVGNSPLILKLRDNADPREPVRLSPDVVEFAVARTSPRIQGREEDLGIESMDASDRYNYHMLAMLDDLGIPTGYIDRTGILDTIYGGPGVSRKRPEVPPGLSTPEINDISDTVRDAFKFDPYASVHRVTETVPVRNSPRDWRVSETIAVPGDLPEEDQLRLIAARTGVPIDFVRKIVAAKPGDSYYQELANGQAAYGMPKGTSYEETETGLLVPWAGIAKTTPNHPLLSNESYDTFFLPNG